jgi:pantetheine-phosphate adenylyltransferase
VLKTKATGPAHYKNENVMKIAVYPGTFNPITNGHMDLAERAAGLFDKIIVAVVGKNQQKQNTLPLEQRVQLTKKVLGHLENVEVRSFDRNCVSRACGTSLLHLIYAGARDRSLWRRYL